MKRVMTILSAAAASAVLLAACWSPPFDEDISLAVLAEGNMNRLYEFTSGVWIPDNAGYRFLPHYDPVSPGGFLIAEDLAKYFMFFYAVPWSSSGPIGTSLPDPGTVDPVNSLFYGAPGSPRLAASIIFDIGGILDYEFLVWNNAMGTVFMEDKFFDFPAVSGYLGTLAVPVAELTLTGLHFYPDPDASRIILHALIHWAAGDAFFELEFVTDEALPGVAFKSNINSVRSGGAVDRIALGGRFPLPGKAAYFHSPVSGRSYMNFRDPAGSWKTFTWTASAGTAGPSAIGVGEKIQAVLTTGEILTTDGGYGRAYNPGGGLKYRFPLGEMRFGYEIYLDNTPTLVFSRGRRDKYFGYSLGFDVFSLPTADLYRLE